MRTRELTAVAEPPARRVHQRVAWLCGAVLFLEGYDVAAAGNAIPSLVDAWKLRPALLTPALTAGNIGLLLGLLGVGLLGDRLRRRPLIICCVLEFGFFTLLSALVQSPLQLASLRFLTGLGLGGTLPLAMAIAADFAPRRSQGGFVILTNVGVPIGVTFGGLLASQLVRAFGWPAIFVAAGVLPIAVAPLLVLLPDGMAQRPEEAQNLRTVPDRLRPGTRSSPMPGGMGDQRAHRPISVMYARRSEPFADPGEAVRPEAGGRRIAGGLR
jgi:MFS transporter, AAHS family, 4-hydroxybenzoate transporter